MAIQPTEAMTVRAPAMRDIEAVVDLLNACALQDTGVARETIEHVRHYWALPRFDREHNAWVVIAPDQRIAGYSEVGLLAEQPIRKYLITGGVHPDYLRQGIGTRLLQHAETRARILNNATTITQGVLLSADTWSTNLGAQRLFETVGFTVVRTWLRMEITMQDTPPGVQYPPRISIRAFQREQDIPELYQVMRDSYSDNWYNHEMTLEQWQQDYIDHNTWYTTPFDPALWFIAIDGTQIVGAALCRWERPGDPHAGHLTDVFVHPSWRRRGVGRALLQHAFATFHARGKRRVSLGVDADNMTDAPKLYTTAGMQVVLRQYLYEKELQ